MELHTHKTGIALFKMSLILLVIKPHIPKYRIEQIHRNIYIKVFNSVVHPLHSSQKAKGLIFSHFEISDVCDQVRLKFWALLHKIIQNSKIGLYILFRSLWRFFTHFSMSCTSVVALNLLFAFIFDSFLLLFHSDSFAVCCHPS